MGNWFTSQEDSDIEEDNNQNNNNKNFPSNNNINTYINENIKALNQSQNSNNNSNSNIYPNLTPFPASNYDFNISKNSILNSSQNLSLLKNKRNRTEPPKEQIKNNDMSSQTIKMKKLESNPQQQNISDSQIIKVNKSITQLIEENKKLKQENEENKKLINQYNLKLKDLENEIQTKVQEALNQINNEKSENENNIRQIIKNALNAYKKENEDKLNLIISEIPNKMEKDFQQKAKELENLYFNSYINKKKNNKINNEVHSGIKCQECKNEPIIGIRYKCSVCPNYNLCENCEKENQETNFHPHIFLKYVKKEEISELNEQIDEKEEINNNINENKKEININTDINQNKKEKVNNNNIIESHIIINKNKTEFNHYSYMCPNNQLGFQVFQGTKEYNYHFEIKNNGKFPWLKNKSFLTCDTNISDKIIDDILLEPLNPGNTCTVHAHFNDLDYLAPGKYNTYLDFNVNNKIFGEQILILFEIIQKNAKFVVDPKIVEFRNQFKVDEKTMSDEVIKKALDNNNNDVMKAFENMFN